MKIRIVQSYSHGKDWFTPQWSIDGVVWMEFFGFDSDSPYLHMRSFNDLVSAQEFAKNPSIMEGAVVWQSP